MYSSLKFYPDVGFAKSFLVFKTKLVHLIHLVMSFSPARQLQLLRQEEGDVYQHLLTVLMRSQGGVERAWEEVSIETKANPLRPSPHPSHEQPRPRHPLQTSQQSEWSRDTASILRAPDRFTPIASEVKLPDLMQEAGLLTWAGIGLGPALTFRLYLSMKALADCLPSQVGRLRFWGRILTRGLPYFIIEGNSITSSEEDNSPPIDLLQQEGREGANKNSYWVSQSLEKGAESWSLLPSVTCRQIILSKKFHRLFSGDLEAEVASYPPFPGREKSLLRAQIARISAATLIAPEGFFEVVEDSDPPLVAPVNDIEEDKDPNDLLDSSAWQHIEREFNELGRVTALPPLPEGEEEEEEREGEDVEVPSDLAEARSEAWTLRLCPGSAGVAAKSLDWPGAVAVVSGRQALNVYLGNGIAFTGRRFEPMLPPPLQREWLPEEDALPLLEQADTLLDPSIVIPDPVEEEEEGEGDQGDEGGGEDE